MAHPDQPHEFHATWAIRDAAPTRAHAEMLFDQVVDLLGDQAWVETWSGGAKRTMFRREEQGSTWIIPWPILTVTRGGREGPEPTPTDVPGVYAEPKPRPGRAPRIRGLGPGELNVRDGRDEVTIAYGKDGRWFECMRSQNKNAFADVVDALAMAMASPVEMLASYLAERDAGRHGPGRVQLPVALPQGAAGSWSCGLHGVREALFYRRAPRDARWLATDGWTGTAFGYGTTIEDAVHAWRGEVDRLRPFPRPTTAKEPPPEFLLPDGFLVLRGPSSDVPQVEPTVSNTPCIVIPIAELPSESPSIGEWVRLVNAYGSTFTAAVRHEAEGFTLVGDRLLSHMRLADIEQGIANADLDAPARPDVPYGLPFEVPARDCRVRTYRLVDERSGKPVQPAVSSCSWTERFHPGGLDGEQLRCKVVRQRFEQ